MSLSGTKKPKKPSTNKGGSISSESQSCEKIKYKLVDFVEVVTRGSKKMWVEGLTDAPGETKVFNGKVTRPKIQNKDYRQYINLNPDTEGGDKRHPEYGRKITFRARVEREDKKKDKLSGIQVLLKRKLTKAANRATSDDKIWRNDELTGAQKDGFGAKAGPDKKTITTGNDGWTPEISFYTSQYGGDQFEISAELKPAPNIDISGSSKKIKTKKIEVWRKFWYQMTYANNFAAKEPKKAAKAFAKVFAEMVLANEKKFRKEDFDADFQNRTFYKEYQLKKGGHATNIVANVGTGNIIQFRNKAKLKLKKENEHPVKDNLIVCEFQCDPLNEAMASPIHSLKANGGKVTFPLGNIKYSPIVSKPALAAGAALVIEGEWSRTQRPWAKGGSIADGCVEVYHGRETTYTVKVDLSKGATGNPPVPTQTAPVYIKLKVRWGKAWAGWADPAGIVATYVPPPSSSTSNKNEIEFNNTTAHEFGHKVGLTPRNAATKLPSLKNHPKQYVAHGGSGSHCRSAVTKYTMGKCKGWSENQLTFQTKTKTEPSTTRNDHEVTDPANFDKLVGQAIKVNGTNRTLKGVKGKKLVFTQKFLSAKDQVVKHSIKTKIKKAETTAKTIHEVVDANALKKVEGLDVFVNGVKKTLKKVNPGNKLEFTSGFTSTKDAAVEFKIQTTIKNDPTKNTDTYELDDPTDFKDLGPGSTVWIAGVERKLKAVNGSRLVFEDEFDAPKGSDVKKKVNWQNAGEKEPEPEDRGSVCIMFHRTTDKESRDFCKMCQPCLQLAKMKTL
ncbi:MAG: hypothetical protein HUN04_25435 [Desulfobacter sp.]|nr:MAG: hypothetical protein HUN04_25435 [Desulfobacter sp.]